MKKMVLLALVASLALSTISCAAEKNSVDEGKTGEKNVELTFWHSAYTTTEEKEKPEKEWLVNQICQSFEEKNPGVKIKSIYTQDQNTMQSKLKAAVLADDAPDLVNIYAGYVPTSFKDVLLDITQYIPKEDKETITAWDTVSEGLALGNPILGYPSGGIELGCLVYNKELVEKAGVDLEGAGKPKTAQEFYDAMVKIKDSGVLPIVGEDGGINGAFMFSFGSWWTQQVGSERVTSNSLGKTKFAEDTAFLESIGMVQKMYKDGLINEDYASAAQVNTKFYAGEAAMLITGNWAVADAVETLGDKAGFYTVPSFKDGIQYPDACIGGVGQSISVVNTTKNPQEAVNFISFFNNKENTISMAKALSKIPQRTDITAEDLDWKGNALMEKQLELGQKQVFAWNDNSMQPDVMNEYYKLSGMVVIDQMTPEECAKQLDKKAAEVNK